MDKKAAEKAAKEEQERKNKEIVSMMHIFSHGNVLNIPEDPRIDANNFELRMPLIQTVEQYPFEGRTTRNVNRHLTKFIEIANTLKLNGVGGDAKRVSDATPRERPTTRSMVRRLQEAISTFIQKAMREESMKVEEPMMRIVLNNEDRPGVQRTRPGKGTRPGLENQQGV